MKTRILLLFMMSVLAYSQTHAKIWRVNNRTGIVADFTTLQAAHDGALAGDTVMLEPSPTSYGNLTCTKKLIILGAGWFVVENYPNYFSPDDSIIGSISFEIGSQNSVLMGVSGGSASIKTSSILIDRNSNISINITSTVSNIQISKNYLVVLNAASATGSTNIIVRNNYLNFSGALTYPSSIQVLFTHNIFTPGSTYTFNGQTFTNNIAAAGATMIFNTGTLVSHNIDAFNGSRAVFGTANGNIGGVTQAIVFVGATGNSTDGRWKLKAGSPAISAGADGSDCGMFGGQDPYVLSGVPPIPLFTKLLNSSVGSNTSPVKITISVESKN